MGKLIINRLHFSALAAMEKYYSSGYSCPGLVYSCKSSLTSYLHTYLRRTYIIIYIVLTYLSTSYLHTYLHRTCVE